MDAELLAPISAARGRRHPEEQQGELTWFPEPSADGSLLSANAKGIYKPADLLYVLSTRINLSSD
jgi:hypothetical protein